MLSVVEHSLQPLVLLSLSVLIFVLLAVSSPVSFSVLFSLILSRDALGREETTASCACAGVLVRCFWRGRKRSGDEVGTRGLIFCSFCFSFTSSVDVDDDDELFPASLPPLLLVEVGWLFSYSLASCISTCGVCVCVYGKGRER